MYEDFFVQGSPAWIEFRKDKIGASDAPVIMGVSSWTTPYQLWTYKMGLAETKMNEAMQRGKDMEEEARKAFIKAYGIYVEDDVWIDKKYPWCIASLDGISHDKKTLVEIKTPGQEDHKIAVSGDVPEKYWPQLQHQLYVSGLKNMWYFSYRSETDYKGLWIKRNDEYIEKMLDAEKEFYRRMMEFDPPPLCDKDYVDMSGNVDFRYHSLIYSEYARKKKEAENNMEHAKKAMIELCPNNARNEYIKMTQYEQKGKIDYSKIPELEKVDLEKYRKPVVRCYRITEIGEDSNVEV